MCMRSLLRVPDSQISSSCAAIQAPDARVAQYCAFDTEFDPHKSRTEQVIECESRGSARLSRQSYSTALAFCRYCAACPLSRILGLSMHRWQRHAARCLCITGCMYVQLARILKRSITGTRGQGELLAPAKLTWNRYHGLLVLGSLGTLFE
jgi:hypothetical protein